MVGQSEFRDILRRAGLRATAARVTVLRCLQEARSPLTHAEVCERTAAFAFDRATVYRNLTDLTEVGLARRSDLGDHVWRFELVTTADHGGAVHPHFICNECGTVECLPEASIAVPSSHELPRSLRHNDVEIQVRGVCDNCD